MGRVRWVVMVAALLVGAIAPAGIAIRGFSLLSGCILLAAAVVAVLALCGRVPGQSFFGDLSPTRAHDSLQYP